MNDAKLIDDMDKAFSVLGEGWMYDPVMSQMFDECINAAREFSVIRDTGEEAKTAPERPIRKISLFLAKLVEIGFWFTFFCIWYGLAGLEITAMVFMAMTIYKLSN